MIYGLIFSGHMVINAEKQRSGILQFASKHNFNLDQFVYFDTNPQFGLFKHGDTIICYSWDCLCKETTFLRLFMLYLAKNHIYLYSTTSNYCIGKTTDIKSLYYAFALYEDVRVKFWSNKTQESAKKRSFSGRRRGSKNQTHILDGKEKVIWQMYSRGASMYAIAKKLKVSSPTIKRFLVSQQITKE